MRTNRMLSALGAVVLALSSASTAAAATPVIAIAPNDSPATIIANAANVVPSPRQLAWQRQEMTTFIHFGVNMFDGRELGTGTEDPTWCGTSPIPCTGSG